MAPCLKPTPENWRGEGRPGFCECGEPLAEHDPLALAAALHAVVVILADTQGQLLEHFHELADIGDP